MLKTNQEAEGDFADSALAERQGIGAARQALARLSHEHPALPTYAPLMLVVAEYARAQAVVMGDGDRLSAAPVEFWSAVEASIHEDLRHMMGTFIPRPDDEPIM